MTKKGIVTFVGTSYAKPGFKFYFDKPRTDICPKSCRFLNTCMLNLEPDTIYEVSQVQDVIHDCPSDYHDEKMQLVKVSESDILVLMESKSTFLGATTRYQSVNCRFDDCSYKEYCAPIQGLPDGTKVKIVEVIEKVSDQKCEGNFSLVKVEKVE